MRQDYLPPVSVNSNGMFGSRNFMNDGSSGIFGRKNFMDNRK